MENTVSRTISNHQLADLLLIAKKRLAYCKFISSFPENNGFKHFSPSVNIDAFYKSVYNVCFYEALLITSTLLDKDTRVISFWNRQDLVSAKKEKLNVITEEFKSLGLKTIRDQLVGHMDISNQNNNYPYSRIRGIISKTLVKSLSDVLIKSIEFFREYMKECGNPYSDEYFNTTDSYNEIQEVMEKARPQMTNEPVI